MIIGVLHSLRKVLESNTEMNALSVSGLHHFNQRAFQSLVGSLEKNSVLQTVNFGNLTQV